MTDAPAPRVSVVVAAHQAAATLGRALDSALDQGMRDLEVLVVDDASTDGTADLVRARAKQDPRVRLIRLDANGGPARARNRAIAEARGSWIALLDADDAFAPGRLEHLLDVADDSGADLVADNLRYVEAGSGRVLGTALPVAGPAWVEITPPAFVVRNAFTTRTFKLGYLKPLIRRRLLQDQRVRYREDLRIGEDFHLDLDCLLAGGRLVLTPEPLYDYTQTPASQSRRLTIADVERLHAANAEAASRAQTAPLKGALVERGRDLERQLKHMRLIELMKARSVGRAVACLVRAPGIWPLALVSGRESISKRLRRLLHPKRVIIDLAPADLESLR